MLLKYLPSQYNGTDYSGRRVYNFDLGDGGGGGGSTPQPTQISQLTIPEYAQPYMETLLGKAQALTSSPYQTYDQNRIAGPTEAQLAARADVAGMTAPAQYQTATDMATKAGLQALSGSQYTPGQFTAQQVTAPSLTNYQMGPAQNVSAQQMTAPEMQAAQTGYRPDLEYFQMAGPEMFGQEQVNQYMSPYIRNVLDVQKEQAIRDAQQGQLMQNLGAARQGTYGGARQLLAGTERERNLGFNLANIEAQGLQAAYQNAQQQFERDRAAGMQTGAQNLAAKLGVQQLGTQTGLQTALANLSSQQQANVQNQAAKLQAMGMNQEQALRAALANQQAGLTVGQQNLQALLGVQQLGAGQNLQSQLANQDALMRAQQMAEQSRQFGGTLGLQGAQTALQSALGLGQIGTAQQQSALDLAKAQEAFGALDQQQQQQLMNLQYQDFLTQQQYPYKQLGFMSDLLRGSANLAGAGGTTMYQAPPSLYSQLGGLGLAGLGMYNLTK